jgi:hypothetical protein
VFKDAIDNSADTIWGLNYVWDVLLLHNSFCLFSKTYVLIVQSKLFTVNADREFLFFCKLRWKCLLLFISRFCKELLNFLIILLELFTADALIQSSNSTCHLDRLL